MGPLQVSGTLAFFTWAAFFRLVCCLHKQNLFLLDSNEVVSFSPRNIYILLPPTWPESDDCVPGPLPDNLKTWEGLSYHHFTTSFTNLSDQPLAMFIMVICGHLWSWCLCHASPPKKCHNLPLKITAAPQPSSVITKQERSPRCKSNLVVFFPVEMRMSPRKADNSTPTKNPYVDIVHLHIATGSLVIQPLPSKCLVRIRI